MPTLSGFTRPSDPINAIDMGVAISTAIGKTVTCIITSTDVEVSGVSISGADTSAIQIAMTAYQYAYLQYGAVISDITDMSTARHDRAVTERVAYLGDLGAYNLGKRKNWISGALKENSFIYASKALTAGGAGAVTFYLTDDGTSSGNAVFSNVYPDSILVVPLGASGNYQAFSPVVAGDKKSITASVSQATNVLGLLTFNASAANGIDCRLYVIGD